MDWARDLALILTAIGGTAIGPKLVGKGWQAITGRSARRRTEADVLRDDLDRERRHLRITEESLWQHRRVIVEAPCLTDADLPEYPTWTSKD
ncbi:MAG: hypothetical protein ABWX92_09875 [Mycetocola sp.]